MKFRLSIDRFEGDRREIAVLILDDGRTIDVPRDLLPKGAQAGEVLMANLARDPKATAELAERARALRQDLGKTDPGGDIRL